MPDRDAPFTLRTAGSYKEALAALHRTAAMRPMAADDEILRQNSFAYRECGCGVRRVFTPSGSAKFADGFPLQTP